MAERRIGIRELKSKLSECVREVREGQTILVTQRGRVVARLIPEATPVRASLAALEFAARADVVATSLISRAEVAAALTKAVRAKLLEEDEARQAQRAFAAQWPDIARVPVTEALVSRAETLVWEYGLRGYDAIQ